LSRPCVDVMAGKAADGAPATLARSGRGALVAPMAGLARFVPPGPILSAALLGLSVQPASAHPHVFIDAGITLMTDDDGTITAVEVTWLYDELYTLILLQDYELDTDFDGALTQAEVADTLGFDLNWNSGFEGGLYLSREGTMLELGTPEPLSLSLREDGRMQTTHRRPVAGDPGRGVVEAQVYDEAFFIAFEATLPSAIAGTERCTPELVRADLDAAYAILEAEIASIGGFIAAEDNFPPVGAYFADKLVFSCAP
jgi:ABC-type uncharacterized transport system substrate-binding protein